MRLARDKSGGFRRGLEEGAVTEHRPQDIDFASGERQHCLVVPFALGPLPVVVSSARRVMEAREGGLEEYSLERVVPRTRALQVALGLARVSRDRGEARVRPPRPSGIAGNARDVATVARNSAPRHGPMPGRLMMIRAWG